MSVVDFSDKVVPYINVLLLGVLCRILGDSYGSLIAFKDLSGLEVCSTFQFSYNCGEDNPSLAPAPSAKYSALTAETLTVFCFPEYQEMAALFSLKGYTVVDFLSSLSPAKSKSLYPNDDFFLVDK